MKNFNLLSKNLEILNETFGVLVLLPALFRIWISPQEQLVYQFGFSEFALEVVFFKFQIDHWKLQLRCWKNVSNSNSIRYKVTSEVIH